MINETKNTSASEWCFDEGCEKSPSAVILAFFTGTSSLRNNYTHFNHKFKSMIMMPVRLCFEIRIFYHLVKQRKKITAIGLNSDFFHLILMVHCLFTFHYANKYNILAF